MSRQQHVQRNPLAIESSSQCSLDGCTSRQAKSRSSGFLENRKDSLVVLNGNTTPSADLAGSGPRHAVGKQDILNVLRAAGAPAEKIAKIKSMQEGTGFPDPDDFRMAVLNDVLKDPKLIEGLGKDGLLAMSSTLRELRRNYHPSDGGVNAAQLDAECEVARRLGIGEAGVAKLRGAILDAARNCSTVDAGKPDSAPEPSPISRVTRTVASDFEGGLLKEENSCASGRCPIQEPTRRRGVFALFRR